VGVIPEDWRVACVGDAFEVCNNLRLPISGAIREQMLGDFPYYGPTNIQGWINEFRVEGEYALIGEDGDHFLKWRTQPMTLLVRGRFNVNNHAHLVRGSSNVTAWFYWYFVNRDITASLTRQGASRYKLNKATLLQLPCVLPPPSEQRAIASALSDVDALLGGLDRLIAKKQGLKQATMQQLLTGQTRLPGFSGEWEVKRLEDVADMGSGGTPLSSVPAYYDGKIPWVAISDMTKGGKIIESTERNLTALGLANSAAQMFPIGTVLYAMYASLGECSIAGVSLCTSQAILGIRPRSNLNADFLYYYLTSLKSVVKTLGQQGTQSNLNKGMVQDFRLSLPLVPEQTAIAAVLSDMDAELAALQARRSKTQALKQAMMQELLTGRIRLV
jgi:type I restriction enzyme S subunit